MDQKGKDNWNHRSSGMVCDTCMWFAEKAGLCECGSSVGGYHQVSCSVAEGPVEAVKSTIGRCRRRCPTMNGFPAVFHTDWCGDHKLDETKI